MITEKKEGFMSGLGLDELGDLSSMLDAPVAAGVPVDFEISDIDEDPNQPRKEFDEESLKELASNIQNRKVKTPISVRTNPDNPGRFIINHGARRFRASIIAGNSTIPGFIDEDYNKADQVVENLQRDNLTPREIAEYIGEEVAKGVKKGDIAKALGKSNAYISQHVILLDLPEAIADVFYSGRCTDVTVVNEIVKLIKKDEGEVVGWLSDPEQELTRGTVRLLKEWITEKKEEKSKPPVQEPIVKEADSAPKKTQPAPKASIPRDPDTVDIFNGGADGEVDASDDSATPELKEKNITPTTKSDSLKNPILRVANEAGSLGEFVLDMKPSMDGFGWVLLDNGELEEFDLGELRLVALIDD